MLDLAIIVGAYALGCFCTGYYLVRTLKGIDVRTVGSGSAGGTNVARVLGGWARPTVGGADLLKGAIAVAIAQWAGASPPVVGAAAFAVVLGHVFPAQLGFRGGKGIGTSLGAFLVYTPLTAVTIAVLTVALKALTKRSQVSGIVAYVLAAIATPLWASSWAVSAAVVATTLLVLYANRVNFVEDFRAGIAAPQSEA